MTDSLSKAKEGAAKDARDQEVGSTVNYCPAKACRVEVRANHLSLNYYHLFIIFVNSVGKEYYLRGGPSAGPGPSGSSGEISGGSSQHSSGSSSGSGSNSKRSSDSGGAGPYGYIITEYGAYGPSTIDWDVEARVVLIASGLNVCGMYNLLKLQMDAIAASKTKYTPLGPNSNSAVFTSLKNVGLVPRVPEGVWAPGADVFIATRK